MAVRFVRFRFGSRTFLNKKDQEEAEREMPETGDTQMEEAAEKDWRGIVGFTVRGGLVFGF